MAVRVFDLLCIFESVPMLSLVRLRLQGNWTNNLAKDITNGAIPITAGCDLNFSMGHGSKALDVRMHILLQVLCFGWG